MKKIVENARKCLEKHQERESDNIRRAEEAIDFRALKQWPESIRSNREDESQDGGPRPCPVLDKTNQYVRQIVNEERQNRAAIRIRPVDDDADKDVAEVLTGIIRHIEDQSQAIEAYTTGGEHAIDGGFGYWRILTEYTDPLSFDQDILIKRIPNRFSVALGPHQESDGSDAKEGLIWEDMPTDEFKRKYPKAKEVSFDDTWGSEDHVRVAEYMCIKPESFVISLMEDGQIVKGEQKDAVTTRKTEVPKVKWYKVTSSEVLEERDILGSYIPIVKVVGNELYMADGKCRLSGAVEAAMDPQRLHNYAHAGFIETVALAPRAPWLAEDSSIEGFESDYKVANKLNISVLKYKSVSDELGQPIPPPTRLPPPGISPGWQQMLQNTEHGVESTFGMYGPSVGRESQEKSGIALQEQKIQGMIGNFHFPDNLARSIQHTGRILLEWIPRVYDRERVTRMLGEDGESDMVYLNPDQEQAIEPRMDEMGQEIGSIYNLNIGKYDVTVSTGPSYTSKRQEAVENQLQLINARPDLLSFFGDIILKNMDWPGSDDIADRMKAMLPPEIQQMEASKDKKPVDPQVLMMQRQIEEASKMMEARGQELAQMEQAIEQEAAKTNADKVKVEAMKKDLEASKKVFMADIRCAEAETKLQAKEIMDQLNEEKEVVDEGRDLSTIAGSLNGLGSVLEQTTGIGQALENLAGSMNQLAQMQSQNTEILERLLEIQSRPKSAKLSDGRVITVTDGNVVTLKR